MSYDIDLIINTGVEDTSVLDIGNYTSNIGGMYNKAFGQDWKFINGMNCQEALPFIINAVLYMKQNKKDLIKMNPENGWGDYDGALKYLSDLELGCVNHPNCKIEISY